MYGVVVENVVLQSTCLPQLLPSFVIISVLTSEGWYKPGTVENDHKMYLEGASSPLRGAQALKDSCPIWGG